jgi:hypothetical protein
MTAMAVVRRFPGIPVRMTTPLGFRRCEFSIKPWLRRRRSGFHTRNLGAYAVGIGIPTYLLRKYCRFADPQNIGKDMCMERIQDPIALHRYPAALTLSVGRFIIRIYGEWDRVVALAQIREEEVKNQVA